MADYFNPWDTVAKVHADQRAGEESLSRVMHNNIQVQTSLRQMLDQQQLRGVLSSDMPDDQKMQALMAGKAGSTGIDVAHKILTMKQQQAQQAEAARQTQFFSPQNVAQFNKPGSPAQPAQFSDTSTQPDLRVQPTAFDPSGGANATLPVQTAEAKPAVAPSLDLRSFATQGVMQGIKGAEPLLNHLTQRDQAQATLAQTAQLRREQLQQQATDAIRRSEDRGLDRDARSQASREANQIRMELARLTQVSRAPIQSDQGLFDRGPDGGLVPLMGPDGKQLKPAASGRIDLSYASQLQRQFNGFNKPLIENLTQVGMYDAARQSGDTAQAAVMAASALRQASRSDNRALKGDVEKLLGSGYGSGNLYERMENFISNELSGSPSNNTLSKIDSLIRVAEDANLSGIANNLNNAATQARARNIPAAHVAVPVQRGNKVAFPDGNVARFKDAAGAKAAVDAWIGANQ
jgi:hypothetical protein